VANDVLAGAICSPRPARPEHPPLRSHDAIVVEAPGALYALPRLDLDVPVVFLHTTWRLAGPAAHSFEGLSPVVRPLARLDRRLDAAVLSQLLRRYVDGVVTVSNLFERRIHETFDGPTTVHRPYVSSDLADRLLSTEPSYGTDSAVLVCSWREHKGVDVLVEAWGRVRDEVPGATLTLVGAGHPDRYADRHGVRVVGYVEELVEALANASLYVHPARLDAFPVSVLEALCAGLPTVVTRTTGVSEVLGELPAWLTVAPDPESVAAGVVRYLSLPASDRRELGQAARAVGRRFAGPPDEGFDAALDAVLGDR
jgi:glycosyltransferase involved in cell wall biosynthesis